MVNGFLGNAIISLLDGVIAASCCSVHNLSPEPFASSRQAEFPVGGVVALPQVGVWFNFSPFGYASRGAIIYKLV